MSKVRVRPETGTLYLDFFYRGVRCREQTTLVDTAENRKKVQALLNRIERDIKQGSFDYAATFPGSARAAQFANEPSVPMRAAQNRITPSSTVAAVPAPAVPTFEAFWKIWRAEMAPQWRRQHRASVDRIFDKHLVPQFGARCLSDIAKPEVLTGTPRGWTDRVQDAALGRPVHERMRRTGFRQMPKGGVDRQVRQQDAGPAHAASRGPRDRQRRCEAAAALEDADLALAGLDLHTQRSR